MIAQLQGEHFTINEVSKILPGRPNVSTIWRWVTKGCRGQQLATIRIGGINYIAKSELERFLSATNDRTVSICNKSRVKQLAKVSADLDAELA
jgi:hypothetical protein